MTAPDLATPGGRVIERVGDIWAERNKLRTTNSALVAALEFIARNAEQLAEDKSRQDRGMWMACAEHARATLALARQS